VLLALVTGLLAAPPALYWSQVDEPLGSDARYLSHENRYNQEAGGFGRLWTSDFFAGAGSSGLVFQSGYYRPLTSSAHWVLHHLAGEDPVPYNLIQIALHGINAVLVLAVLLSLSGSVAVAGIGAALFVLHPVHAFAAVEPAALGDVLFPAFFLAGLWTFDVALRSSSPWGRRFGVVAATVSYTLAILSKEMGITLPAILVLVVLLRWTQGHVPLRRAIWTLPAWGVLGTFLVWRFGILAFPLHDFGYAASHGAAAVAAAGPRGALIHLSRILVPTGAAFPELNPRLQNVLVAPWTDPLAWAGLATCLALGVAAVLLWRRRPWIAFWSAFFLVTYSPLLSVERIARSINPDVILTEERWIYLPSLAVVALVAHAVAAGMARMRDRRSALTAGALLALLLVVLGATARTHAGRFRDPYAQLRRLYLFPEEALSPKEHASRLLLYAQWVAVPQGDLEDAETRARRAEILVPDSPIPSLELARILGLRGRWSEVSATLARWRQPGPPELARLETTNPRIVEDVNRTAPGVALLLGRAAAHSGDGVAAVEHLCRALGAGAQEEEVARAFRELPGGAPGTPVDVCDAGGEVGSR
jgi:hypothetical protein